MESNGTARSLILVATLLWCYCLPVMAADMQSGARTATVPPKVTQLRYSPATPQSGSPITFAITVGNSGSQASGDNYSLWLSCKMLSGGGCPFPNSVSTLQNINGASARDVSIIPANSWPAGKYKVSASVLDQAKNRTGVIEAEITVALSSTRPVGNGTMTNQAVKPGEAQGFIPQPEPPGKQASGKYVKPGEAQGFIPQPEPPGKQLNKQTAPVAH